MKSLVVYPADELLVKGLEMAGYDETRQKRVQRATNLDIFQSHLGSAPVVYAEIWEDLQTTTIPEARIDTTKRSVTIENFFHAMHFIKRYPEEIERAGKSGTCTKHVRNWGWYFLEKIAALKHEKVHPCACFDSLNQLIAYPMYSSS